jgi:hypothetical protein
MNSSIYAIHQSMDALSNAATVTVCLAWPEADALRWPYVVVVFLFRGELYCIHSQLEQS